MSEAPAELWLRCSTTGHWWQTRLEPREPSAVRYVRADLYEALLARLAVVRSWNEAPCLDDPLSGMAALLDFGPYRPL